MFFSPALLLFISTRTRMHEAWLCQRRARLDGVTGCCSGRGLCQPTRRVDSICACIRLRGCSFVCTGRERQVRKRKKREKMKCTGIRARQKKEKEKERVSVCVCVCCSELVLFRCDLVTVDAPDESVYSCPCPLALYSYCKTSRLIFESACECTCAVMHAADKLL